LYFKDRSNNRAKNFSVIKKRKGEGKLLPKPYRRNCGKWSLRSWHCRRKIGKKPIDC